MKEKRLFFVRAFKYGTSRIYKAYILTSKHDKNTVIKLFLKKCGLTREDYYRMNVKIFDVTDRNEIFDVTDCNEFTTH